MQVFACTAMQKKFTLIKARDPLRALLVHIVLQKGSLSSISL